MSRFISLAPTNTRTNEDAESITGSDACAPRASGGEAGAPPIAAVH